MTGKSTVSILLILSLLLGLSACGNDASPAGDEAGEPESPVQASGNTLNSITFSALGGLYDDSFLLELATDLDGVIRYTLDGSEPTGESPAYESPLKIADRTEEENNLSAIVTESQRGGMGGGRDWFNADENAGDRTMPGGNQPPQDDETQQGEGQMPPQGVEGQTPPQDMEGQTPPQGMEGQTPPQDMEGQTPPQDMEGQTPPQDMEGQTPPQGGNMPGNRDINEEGEPTEGRSFEGGEMPDMPNMQGGGFMGGSVAAPEENVFKGTVLTAAVFSESGEKLTDSVVQSYFVSDDILAKYELPVISIVTDADNLYDDETGIFTNYEQSGSDWERAVHIEMFEADGTPVISQYTGLRLSGNSSRSNAQKSLRFYARAEYDEENSSIEYEIFEDYEKGNSEGILESFKRIVLRNSGNDNTSTLFRDMLMQEVSSEMNVDIQAGQPCVAFVNGEFWGIYNIRERYDDQYFANHYDIDKSEVAVVEITNNSTAAELSEGEESDLEYYNEMWSFFNDNSMTDEASYQKAQEYIDIDNFIDFYIANIYMANTDWPGNNNVAWRYKTENGGYDADAEDWYKDGRFRWVLKDMDFGLGLQGDVSSDTLAHAMSESEGMGFGGGGMGNFEGMELPEGFAEAMEEFLRTGEMPEGFEMPEGMENFGNFGGRGNMPEMQQGEMQQMPEGNRENNREERGGGMGGGFGFSNSYSTLMFRKLLENEDFLTRFVTRFCDIMNTYYSYDNLAEKAAEYKLQLTAAMQEQIDRYPGNIGSIEAWESNIESMLDFAAQRKGYVQGFLQETFALGAIVPVTLDFAGAEAYITINGIEITDSWSGEYFANTQLTLSAASGASLTVTDIATGNVTEYAQDSITVNTGEQGITITAAN